MAQKEHRQLHKTFRTTQSSIDLIEKIRERKDHSIYSFSDMVNLALNEYIEKYGENPVKKKK